MTRVLAAAFAAVAFMGFAILMLLWPLVALGVFVFVVVLVALSPETPEAGRRP